MRDSDLDGALLTRAKSLGLADDIVGFWARFEEIQSDSVGIALAGSYKLENGLGFAKGRETNSDTA